MLKKFIKVTCPSCGIKHAGNTYALCQMTTYLDKNYCFNCSFWLVKIDQKDVQEEKGIVIVDSRMYKIGSGQRGRNGGFGGAEFKLKKIGSDEIIVTKDLNSLGMIPRRFRSALPSTHIFVKDGYNDNDSSENSGEIDRNRNDG